MAHGDAQRVIDVIKEAIRQETKNGASVEYSFGEFYEAASGYYASAYLNGSDSLSEEFRMPAHLHASPGDHGLFAVNHKTGGRFVVEVLPNSLYSKIALDVNTGELLTGDGSSPPSIPFTASSGGDGLIWAGAEFVYAEENGADEFIWE